MSWRTLTKLAFLRDIYRINTIVDDVGAIMDDVDAIVDDVKVIVNVGDAI